MRSGTRASSRKVVPRPCVGGSSRPSGRKASMRNGSEPSASSSFGEKRIRSALSCRWLPGRLRFVAAPLRSTESARGRWEGYRSLPMPHVTENAKPPQ